MVLSPHQTHELCAFADAEARSNLARGYLRGEDDYTSTFTGALRRINDTNTLMGLRATSYLLQTADERTAGYGAVVLISSPSASKAVLFEAKLPRLAHVRGSWDGTQGKTERSHFSDQLSR